MITRIEIDGFKSFRQFHIDLRPFQVLIGPNGVGKSNLFDAIVLLSQLAGDNTLYDAFRNNRGEVGELFTASPGGEIASQMRFAVEMLIGKTVVDALGVTEDVSSNRLRYEISIERRSESGFERLYVVYEGLTAIIEDNDSWFRANIPTPTRRSWVKRGRRSPYISTESGMISKHQDGRGGGKQITPLGRVERTVLSTINSVEYPTAFAARQEMLNWQFLQFNPEELRTPSHIYDRTVLEPDGSNLAAVLWRMSQDDEYALDNVSLDMANIVDVLKVSVRPAREREEFIIEAETNNGSIFTSRVLSDGTLRLLALITLKNDPRHQGVLCFEEPENGVHPSRLEQIVEVLKSLASDLSVMPLDENLAPRQVLVNTHSPKLTACVDPRSLLFVYMSGPEPRSTSVMAVDDTNQPALFPDFKKVFTLEQVRSYLDSSTLESGLKKLDEVRRGM